MWKNFDSFRQAIVASRAPHGRDPRDGDLRNLAALSLLRCGADTEQRGDAKLHGADREVLTGRLGRLAVLARITVTELKANPGTGFFGTRQLTGER